MQTFLISGTKPAVTFNTHACTFKFDDILRSTVYKDNEACLKFSTMPKKVLEQN